MAKDLAERVERLATEVERALGENLLTFLLYGSAARGDYHDRRSDLNLLVIVQDASAAALRPLGPVLRRWVQAGEPPPLVFTEREWRDSADVFPMEIADMREAHRLLRGRDPFQGLETAQENLRLELERETRGKLLHLRASHAAAAADGKALEALLVDSVKPLLVLFRALLRLQGRTPPRDPEELVSAAADSAGFDAGPFQWALARLAGRKTRALAPYDELAAGYVAAIERVARFVDEAGQQTGGERL